MAVRLRSERSRKGQVESQDVSKREGRDSWRGRMSQTLEGYISFLYSMPTYKIVKIVIWEMRSTRVILNVGMHQ